MYSKLNESINNSLFQFLFTKMKKVSESKYYVENSFRKNSFCVRLNGRDFLCSVYWSNKNKLIPKKNPSKESWISTRISKVFHLVRNEYNFLLCFMEKSNFMYKFIVVFWKHNKQILFLFKKFDSKAVIKHTPYFSLFRINEGENKKSKRNYFSLQKFII